MKDLLHQNGFRGAVLAVLTGMSAALGAQSLLRNISAFLNFSPQFQNIFAQIHSASMKTPLWLLCLLAFGFWLPVVKSCHSPGKKLLAALGFVFLWLLLFCLGAFLTTVNGIRFGDVMLSLLDVLEKGGLDGL